MKKGYTILLSTVLMLNMLQIAAFADANTDQEPPYHTDNVKTEVSPPNIYEDHIYQVALNLYEKGSVFGIPIAHS